MTRLDWPACRGGVRVAHLRIEGGRHAWPPLGGPPGIGIDGAEEIWRFFAALPDREESLADQGRPLRAIPNGAGTAQDDPVPHDD